VGCVAPKRQGSLEPDRPDVIVARRYWVGISLENDQCIQQSMNRGRISRLFDERHQDCAPLCESAGDLAIG